MAGPREWIAGLLTTSRCGMNRWITVVASTLILGGACVTPNDLCRQSYQECHLRYSRDYGYYRECNFAASSCAYKNGAQNGQTSQAGSGGAAGDESSAGGMASDDMDDIDDVTDDGAMAVAEPSEGGAAGSGGS